METTSLLKKEVITPRLGGSTNMLIDLWTLFSSSENGPGWVVPFQSRKLFEISYRQAFFSLENGPDRTVIFLMKMVR